MNLFVMRHGYTKMNKEHLYNGQIDEDLIEEGIEGAKEASKIVKDMDLDIIFCSPLIRAKHTCEIINCNNLPVIYDDRLKERTFGDIDGKNLNDEGITDEDFYNYYFETDINGFESIPNLFKRVHSFIDELKKQKYNNVLIVAHGGVLRAIHYYFNDIPEDGNLLSKFKSSKNCQINQYEL